MAQIKSSGPGVSDKRRIIICGVGEEAREDVRTRGRGKIDETRPKEPWKSKSRVMKHYQLFHSGQIWFVQDSNPSPYFHTVKQSGINPVFKSYNKCRYFVTPF